MKDYCVDPEQFAQIELDQYQIGRKFSQVVSNTVQRRANDVIDQLREAPVSDERVAEILTVVDGAFDSNSRRYPGHHVVGFEHIGNANTASPDHSIYAIGDVAAYEAGLTPTERAERLNRRFESFITKARQVEVAKMTQRQRRAKAIRERQRNRDKSFNPPS